MGTADLAEAYWDMSYWYAGKYGTDDLCGTIGFITAVVIADDGTGIGFLDNVSLPFLAPVVTGCAIEWGGTRIAEWAWCDDDAIKYKTWLPYPWSPTQVPILVPVCT